MKVDLPTPGVPVMPTRWAPPVLGSIDCRRAWPVRWWSARVDSTRVIARAKARLSPDSTCSAVRAASNILVGSSTSTLSRWLMTRDQSEDLAGRLWNPRARAEDRRHAGIPQKRVVLRRYDTAGD